jgi:hypothetical protein
VETTAIPVEVLALAFIEFIVVSTLAAVLWYMFRAGDRLIFIGKD